MAHYSSQYILRRRM